jgi:ABC-type polar amino acid transport system ATPase subunit
MAKIHSLEIRNFRGIREFSHTFFDKDFICLVGRGDSCKTTILEGISILFSPNWNITFYDTDFHNCDTSNNIEITGSIIDLPEFLLRDNKFGLYIRGFDEKTGKIHDELADDYIPCLTIKFKVTKDLEPSWVITNNRQDPIKFSNIDRAKLNVYLISDFTDRHFSWNKGNPLYSLLKQEDSKDVEERNIILDAIREAKVKIDENSFDNLKSVIEKIKEGASVLGIDISDTKTSIDFKDIFIKENKVCLHDDHVPFRLKGKGSKRLISISIQVALAKTGGIVLIDEIEQGLEPDRIKHLVRTLCYNTTGQFFISTHSQNVIEEIDSNNLLLIQNMNGTVVGKQIPDDEKFQSLVRACPEAMYSQKVIVCEGKTEIGICRALDLFRIRNGIQKPDILTTFGRSKLTTSELVL